MCWEADVDRAHRVPQDTASRKANRRVRTSQKEVVMPLTRVAMGRWRIGVMKSRKTLIRSGAMELPGQLPTKDGT
jgi:hypothetical protein